MSARKSAVKASTRGKAIVETIAQAEYAPFLAAIKDRVLHARHGAIRAANGEMILLYWDIGRAIVEKQQVAGWGDSVVEKLAADLRVEFTGMRGFSSFNVWRMRQLYIEYSSREFLAQAVPELPKIAAKFLAQPVPEMGKAHKEKARSTQSSHPSIPQSLRALLAAVPWGHHVELLKKVKMPAARVYYLQATAQFGWSRNILLNQIKARAYERAKKEKKTHNFALALPEHFAEQADEMLKSHYNLEFLGITRDAKERALEGQLIAHLQRFILELGYGFCFIGRQHRLALGAKEYFVDLLFYHRFLKALVAFDLKIGSFEPEHAGKMDFYLNVLNSTERGSDDAPSIGIILCAEKSDVEVEFSLKTKRNPIGVAEYRLQQRLPTEFKGKLPTAKQLTDAMRALLSNRK